MDGHINLFEKYPQQLNINLMETYQKEYLIVIFYVLQWFSGTAFVNSAANNQLHKL